jgi:ATP-dependent Clp protease ATP-binding subunit ClpC
VFVFERFTDRARRVVVMAQEESRLLGHGFIGGEHLLLGLLRENGAGMATRSLGVTLEQARREVRAIVPAGGVPPAGHIPFTARAKKIMDASQREAQQLGHDNIAPGDVLITLLGETGGHVADVLAALGVDREEARQRAIALVATAASGAGVGERNPIDLPTATARVEASPRTLRSRRTEPSGQARKRQ